ncbi:MAG: 4-(cytidine 5'-diphospho)-2-C-methyl-D-erythritol kinase [Gemmatimonadota bacterium]
MILRAPAKLNIRLIVLGLRADGYHSIETLFLRLGLADELEVDQAPRLRLETSGQFEVPAGEGNLAWKAAAAFFEAIDRAPAASIRLVKRIPVAAGLGGGSSDAATVLKGLNQAHGQPLDQGRLMSLAGRLGSDVPFFALGAPYALARERGDVLLPLEPPPSRPVLVVVPDFGVAAGDAYAWRRADIADGLEPAGSRGLDLPDLTRLADWGVLAGIACNDLANSVFRRHGSLRAAADVLAGTGCVLTTLCGSGACLAGVYRTETERDKASEQLRGEPRIGAGWRLISTWTEGLGAPPDSG